MSRGKAQTAQPVSGYQLQKQLLLRADAMLSTRLMLPSKQKSPTLQVWTVYDPDKGLSDYKLYTIQKYNTAGDVERENKFRNVSVREDIQGPQKP